MTTISIIAAVVALIVQYSQCKRSIIVCVVGELMYNHNIGIGFVVIVVKQFGVMIIVFFDQCWRDI